MTDLREATDLIVSSKSESATISAVHQTITDKLRLLRTALERGDDRVPQDVRDQVETFIARTGERAAVGPDHTVIALAGSTGSGKSSMINTLTGLEVADVGTRRPTTSKPLSVQWGPGGEDLLAWLKVPMQHRRLRESELDGESLRDLHGLILLDLPDHDSHAVEHKLQVDRLVEQVDCLLWVVDPQKYADDVLHSGYLTPLRNHQDVMVVVLNQVDRLAPDAVDEVMSDLKGLLQRQGLDRVPVVATSTETRQGIEDLEIILRDAVVRRELMVERTLADLESARQAIAGTVADSEVEVDELDGVPELVLSLERAAGVPAVVDAVRRHYVRSATEHTGWPVTRWTQRLLPDPLERLGLKSAEVSTPELTRSSLPGVTPVTRAEVSRAQRKIVDGAGEGLPVLWADAVHQSTMKPDADLADELDQAVMAVELERETPLWWRFCGGLQLFFVACMFIGLLGLAVMSVVAWLQLPQFPMPELGQVPLPTVLFLGGLIFGPLLALFSLAIARRCGARRAHRTHTRLRSAVERVAHEHLLAPVAEIIADHRATRRALTAG